MLAETVQLDGGALLVGLLIVVLILAVVIGAFVLGFVWAARAGRGSQAALAGWIVTLVIQVGLFVTTVAALVAGGGNPFWLVFIPLMVGGQGWIFWRARAGQY